MKTHSGILSCSCTSCTYKTESDRPSLRRFIAQGSRIDRLYYGKYIPLRERKLLERLVRTRGVYDDIRAQLVSDSLVSLDTKVVLKPRRKLSTKNINDNRKTRAILDLVDQVDKGEKFGSKELNDCCSCCSCSSKINDPYESMGQEKHHRVQPRADRDARDYISNYTKRGVRFKAKHIRSDPCTCTYKFSGMIKKKSKKRHVNQPLTVVDLQPTTDEEISQRSHKIKNLARLSYEKLPQPKIHAKDMMMEGMNKVNESKTKIQEMLNLQAKKSVEKLNKAKTKIQKKLSKRQNNIDLPACNCPKMNIITQIKKDSISKFKDDLRKKHLRKKWECKHKCVEDICHPEECFYKLKPKRSRLFKGTNQKENQNDIMKDLMIAKSITRPSVNIQPKEASNIIVSSKIVKQKPLVRAQQVPDSAKFELVDKKINKAQETLKIEKNKHCLCKTTLSHKDKGVKSVTRLPVLTVPNKKTKNIPITHPLIHNGQIIINKKVKNIKHERKTNQHQVVRIGSSFSFNVEFYKTKKTVPHAKKSGINLQKSLVSRPKHSRNVRRHQKESQVNLEKINKRGENILKRCLCTFKLKPKLSNIEKPKHKKKNMVSKESITTSINTKLLNVKTNTHLKKDKKIKRKQNTSSNLCICEPVHCDPYQCIKIIKMRNKKIKKYPVKSGYSPSNIRSLKNTSTSTFSSKSYVPEKKNIVQPIITFNGDKNNRQVVRVGSSISFSVEFYKNKLPYHNELGNSLMNDTYLKSYKTTRRQKNIKGNQSNIYRSEYTKKGFANTLKRCFCTLKLQDKKKLKPKKDKKIITDTEVMDSKIISTLNKSTKTKYKRLKPYECEPFVCIPGACDPYICLERINQRYNNLKEIGSMTKCQGTKTASSFTYAKKSMKNIHIQSKPKAMNRKPFAVTKGSYDKVKLSSSLTNQSAKIGSSFSFNIEFSKTNNKSKEPLNKMKSTTLLRKNFKKYPTKIIRSSEHKFHINDVTKHRKETELHNSSMANHIVKRCFCTLNLQKHRRNRKNPYRFINNIGTREYEVYNIGTASVLAQKDSTDKIKLISNETFYGCNKQKSSRRLLIPSQKFSSSLYSVSVQTWNSKTSYLKDKWMSMSYLQQTEVTNISQFVKNCFCTMNLQLASNNISYQKPKSGSVKVGSSFSFNIDILKNSLTPKYEENLPGSTEYSSYMKLPKLIRNRKKNIGTRNRAEYCNRKLQSGLSSDVTNKRCFCTLKLQKKGRWHMKSRHLLEPSHPMIQSKITVKSVDKAQNTKFKPVNLAQSLKPYYTPGYCDPFQCLEMMKRKTKHTSFRSLKLKPYECEPNVCIPGHCDPYQCLEIIKRRNFYKNTKESGNDTIIQVKKSTASMAKRNHVVKGTQEYYRERVNMGEFKKAGEKSEVLKPSKQVVRVGSNFSFNIEFFKEQVPSPSSHSTYKDVQVIKQPNASSIIRHKMDQIETSSQNSKMTRHKQTKMRRFPKVASTMTTSFLKRCFCTAQLQRASKKNIKQNTKQDVSSPSFLNRCLCKLKSIKRSKKAKQGIHIKKMPQNNEKTNTQNIISMNKRQLLPYECEPGFCIPGECNPYECYKNLKKNKLKNCKTSTINKTRSVFTYNPAIVKRNAYIQSRMKSNQIKKKPGKSRVSFSTSDGQAVKIGSNFSFNIEFYKDKSPNSLGRLKSAKQNSVPSYAKLRKDLISTRSRLTQSGTTRTSDRATDKQHFLKRCFCTLQLHSQYAHAPEVKIEKQIKKNEVKSGTKGINTKKEIQLESFECEPNICIPYQCDPYECEKIIKLRRKEFFKETGILTEIPRKETSCATCPYKRSMRKIQTVDKNDHRKVNFYENTLIERPMQRVKVGSSFDFNIEFFKDKNNYGLDEQSNVKYNKIKMQSEQNLHKTRKETHRPSQISKLKKESTSSQINEIIESSLKKCFCSLFFKKSKKKPFKSRTSSIGTETRKLPETVALLPYECEPQICIPGKCDPYECLERIKNRNLKNFGGNPIILQTKNIASMAENKARLQTKKSQFTTEYDLNTNLSRSKIEIPNHKKQAVRIGSNFNFNIEFYKDKNGSLNESKIDAKHKYDAIEKSARANVNNIGRGCDTSNCPKLKKKHRSTQPNIQKLLRVKKSERMKKSHAFLKKCFCVLKLHTQNKTQAVAPILNQTSNKQRIKLRGRNVTTQKKLLPYECEPNVCVPGECDPYECEKLIKRRLIGNQEKYMLTSKAAITDKCKRKSIKLQASKMKLKGRQQNTKSNLTKNQNEKVSRNSLATSKQVVRVGSTFSFDIEFYKKHNSKSHELKLKTENNKKAKNKIVNTRNRTMVSRGSKAYECLPECDVYSKKKKSYNISTQVIKQCADECVGVKTNYMHTKKNRSSVTDTLIPLPTKLLRKHTQDIVEVPRIRNNLNKQAVKFGSNFSFNIEFYKDSTPEIKSEIVKSRQHKTSKAIKQICPEDTITYTNDKKIFTKIPSKHDHRSQAVVKTEEKSLEAQNALKRCFCTLKLQKNIHSKKHKKKLNAFSKTSPFPQTFEIRRVNVTQKTSKKSPPVRTVATKINKKYVSENITLNSPCKCSLGKNQLPANSTEMKTILPYKPTKFKKASSKTLLQLQNLDATNSKMKGSNITKNGKRLDKKKSQRNIYTNKKSFTIKRFLCRCAVVFTSKHKNNNVTTLNNVKKPANLEIDTKRTRTQNIFIDRLKPCKSDRRPLNPKTQLKQSKSLKLDCTCCDECLLHSKSKKKMRNQDENSKFKDIMNREMMKKTKNAKSSKKMVNAEIKNETQQPILKIKSKRYDHIICDHCLNLSDKNNKDVLIDSRSTFLNKIVSKKKGRNSKKSKRLSENQERCCSCGRIFVKEEIQKGAGDRLIDHFKKDLNETSKIKEKKKDRSNNNKDNLTCSRVCQQKPLFKMRLNTDDYDILNKEEVMDNVAKLTLKDDLDKSRPKKNQIKEKDVKEKKYPKKSKKTEEDNKIIQSPIDQKDGKDFSYKNKASLQTLNNKNYKVMCDRCQMNIQEATKNKQSTPTLKVHFMDTKPKENIIDNSLKEKQISNYKKSKRSSNNQKGYLKEEIKKGAGDLAGVLDKLHDEKFYKSSLNKLKEMLNISKDNDNICSATLEQKPLFEMYLSSDDYDIINKEQFLDNVTRYRTKSKKDNKLHKKSCRCCICLSKRQNGAYIHLSPKGSKIGRTMGKLFNTSSSQPPPLLTNKPCTCGSFVCSKYIKTMHKSGRIHKQKLWKPCVCGSPICDRESAAMKAISPEKRKEKYNRKKEKNKMKKLKAEAKQHAARRKLLLIEDNIRRKKRMKEDKKMEKRINQKSSDIILLAESAIDIGKLGITACTDILRSVARTAADPKHAYYTLKAMKDDPQLMSRHLKTAFADSGVAATARRVRLRCLAMRGVKKIKSTLERYAITNYLLHIADSDPKSRLIKKKKQPVRLRERLDFACSLYMASLRKRPYLWIYDRCPWFYPHFLSLVNVWKQFADITLFLLAVVVWSPCILCMEVCRAMMCCFFCTG